MVLSNVSSASDPSDRHPVSFWARPWVQNVLPLVTSLLFHAGMIVLGIALFQVVKRVSNPNKDQVIIPAMASMEKPTFGPPNDRKTTLMDDPTISTTSGLLGGADVSDPVASSANSNAGSVINPNLFDGPTKAVPSNGIFSNATGNGTPWPGPSGTGGSGPPVAIRGMHGNAQKVTFLCDASGSMLGVFGALKQELRKSVSDLKIEEGQQFNVILFSDANVFPLFKDGLQIATPENKKLALDFIDNAVSTGGTQPLPAIRFAMKQKPQLIFVLTDGFDQISNFDEVIHAFKDGNLDGKTHINCIFLQADEDPKLEAVLKQITADGHGEFKKILKSDM